MGGGGMNAVVSILLTDLVSLRDRALWQGYLNIVFATGIASGAPLGGLMADTIGWRWAFAAQFPLAIVAWLGVYFVLKSPVVDHSHWLKKFKRVDFLGAITLGVAVFLLAFGLDNGSNEGWNTTTTIVSLALTPVTFAIFIFVEVKIASEPFAPGHVILDPPLLAAYGANFFAVAAQMGTLFFIALWYQAAMGLTATQSGLLYIPGTAVALMGSLGGGLVIKRTGKYYWPTQFGVGIMSLAILPLVLFTGLAIKSVVGTVISMAVFLFGPSIGVYNPLSAKYQVSETNVRAAVTTTLIAIISNAAPEDMAVAVACSYLFRSLGTSIGISVSTSVLQQVLRTELASRLEDGDRAREIEEHVRQSLDYIRELPPGLAAIVRDAYAVATTWAFLPIAILVVLCLISSSRIKEKKLNR
jgi:predicted MFS family arabinose efflux permease